MKFTIAALFTLLTSLTIVSAIQSKKFYLVIQSDDSSLQGHALGACHEGAGIEALCKASKVANADKSYQTFQFNYTKAQPNDGLLTWELIGGNFVESEAMGFYAEESTNVALPLFGSYITTYVAFDKDDLMFIRSYLDDTVSPPTSKKRSLYRWYMCETYYTGYIYNTLSWTYGSCPPENPSCKKVNVKRVFV